MSTVCSGVHMKLGLQDYELKVVCCEVVDKKPRHCKHEVDLLYCAE
jgi:hypothetical protein